MSHDGIKGTTMNWIKDFLSNRTQSVVLEEHTFTPLCVLSGVQKVFISSSIPDIDQRHARL